MFGEPLAVAEGFRTAWNRASAAELTAVFTADADFVNVVGFWWRGHRQIAHNHAIGFRDMFGDTHLEFLKTRVRLLGPDHAVVHARWTMTGQVTPYDKNTGGMRRGVFSFVVSRGADGGWLAVSGHNTDIIPNAQTQLVDSGGQLQPVRYDDRDS